MRAGAPELVVERGCLDEAVLAAALGAGGFTVGAAATPPEPLRRSWLDTFDWRLHRAGLELEQIEMNGATSFELRTRKGHDLEASATAPIDWPARAEALPAGVVRDRVAAVTGIRALITTARFEGSRRTLRVLDDEDKTVARLHVDTAAGDDLTPDRVTLSPLRGYDGDAGRAGALLASVNGVSTAATSTYEQALAAAGSGFVDRARHGAAVTAEMPAGAAIAAVLRTFLATVEANVPGVLADIDTEFLHDLRVAVRRARSTVKLAGDILPAASDALSGALPSAVGQLATDLKWLGDATTPTRDLDVYLLGVPAMAARLRAARPNDLDAFRTQLAGYRGEAFARLTADLRSPRFSTLAARWRALSSLEPSAAPPSPTAIEFGAARLRRAHRRVIKLGSTITPLTPAVQLHALRKRCKELRYLIEIFEPIEPPRTRKRVVPVLKALQECLGEFQDSEVQAAAIRSFAGAMMAAGTARPATLLAMGELAGQLDADQQQARATFAGIFSAFAAATRTLHWHPNVEHGP
jgi:CHAD domain-containing protein